MLIEIRLTLPTVGRRILIIHHVENDVAKQVPPKTWGRQKHRALCLLQGRLAGFGHRMEAAHPAPGGTTAP